jgi:DNA-binding MarR family transcriptional regulator
MAFSYRNSVSFRLSQAARILRLRAGAHLGELGLHAGQELVLQTLAEADGQTMSALSRALGVQPPTITKMVTRLAAKGLVRRQASKVDGRSARVFLTDQGFKSANRIDAAMGQLEKEALSGLSAKDHNQLRKLLHQVEGGLRQSAAPDPRRSGRGKK